MKVLLLLAGFITACLLGLSAVASPVSVVSVSPQLLALTPTTIAPSTRTGSAQTDMAYIDITATCEAAPPPYAMPGGASLGVGIRQVSQDLIDSYFAGRPRT